MKTVKIICGGLIGGCAGTAIGLVLHEQTTLAVIMLAVAAFLIIFRMEL